jgi:hypothetical protein
MFFISKNYEKIKNPNMLYLMWDSIFKILQLVSSFIGWEWIVSIVKNYDKHLMFPMLLNTTMYYNLWQIWKCGRAYKWWIL